MILPSESLGVVAYAANDLRVEPALREPAANETVVEVAYGGICGSNLHYWMHGARRRVHPAGADGDIAAQKVVVDRVWRKAHRE